MMVEYIELLSEIMTNKRKSLYRHLQLKYKIYRYIKKLNKEFFATHAIDPITQQTKEYKRNHPISIAKLCDFAILIKDIFETTELELDNHSTVSIKYHKSNTKDIDDTIGYRYKNDNLIFNFFITPVNNNDFSLERELIIKLDKNNDAIKNDNRQSKYIYKTEIEYDFIRIILNTYYELLYVRLRTILAQTMK